MSVQQSDAVQQLFLYESPADTAIAQQHSSEGEVMTIITDLFSRASEESCLRAKLSIYNQIFLSLQGSGCPQGRTLLFVLFEKYATHMCHGQKNEDQNGNSTSTDDELGFRICARLMELSFCLQLEDLGLYQCPYDASVQPSLEALTKNLQTDAQQKGLLFDAIEQASFDVDVLTRTAHEKGLREIMATTLRSLALSYQNIASLADSKYYPFHRKLHDWTEGLIGKDTVEQKRELADYLFDTTAFMMELQHVSWVEQEQRYELLKKVFENCYPPTDPRLLQKQALITNLQGCIIARSSQKGAPQVAEHYLRKALDIALSIPRDKFLIGNVLTSLIDCLASDDLDQQRAARLYNYTADLRRIIHEIHEKSPYVPCETDYQLFVQQAEAALRRYEEIRP